jgi:hypothetical protein
MADGIALQEMGILKTIWWPMAPSELLSFGTGNYATHQPLSRVALQFLGYFFQNARIIVNVTGVQKIYVAAQQMGQGRVEGVADALAVLEKNPTGSLWDITQEFQCFLIIMGDNDRVHII